MTNLDNYTKAMNRLVRYRLWNRELSDYEKGFRDGATKQLCDMTGKSKAAILGEVEELAIARSKRR